MTLKQGILGEVLSCLSLTPARIRLLLDLTTAYFSKAFSIDIIRHKDSMDELFSHRGEIFGTCGEEQKAMLQVNYSYD